MKTILLAIALTLAAPADMGTPPEPTPRQVELRALAAKVNRGIERAKKKREAKR